MLMKQQIFVIHPVHIFTEDRNDLTDPQQTSKHVRFSQKYKEK